MNPTMNANSIGSSSVMMGSEAQPLSPVINQRKGVCLMWLDGHSVVVVLGLAKVPSVLEVNMVFLAVFFTLRRQPKHFALYAGIKPAPQLSKRWYHLVVPRIVTIIHQSDNKNKCHHSTPTIQRDDPFSPSIPLPRLAMHASICCHSFCVRILTWLAQKEFLKFETWHHVMDTSSQGVEALWDVIVVWLQGWNKVH